MKTNTKKVLSIIGVTGAVGTLVFSSVASSHAQQNVGYRVGGTVVVSSAPKAWKERGEFRPHRERHPRIVRAIKALNVAINNLKAGAHDFQGNRVKAIEAAEAALTDARMALKADYK